MEHNDVQEINELKTNIALIKKDVSQIESFFSRIDTSIDKIASMSERISIHDRILSSIEKRLDELNNKTISSSEEETRFRKDLQEQIKRLQDYNIEERDKQHKEFIEAIKYLNKELNTKNDTQDQKIDKLNQWKWWVMGIGAILVLLFSIFGKTIFGL